MTVKNFDQTRRYVADVLERVVWTFAQGSLAVFVGSYSTGALDSWSSARRLGAACAVGGGAAVLSLLKSLAAKQVGTSATASTLPGRLDPGA